MNLEIIYKDKDRNIKKFSVHNVALDKLRDIDAVAYAIKSSLMSKQYGAEEFIAKLVATACVNTLPKG